MTYEQPRITLVSTDPQEPGIIATGNPIWADVLTSTGEYRQVGEEEICMDSVPTNDLRERLAALCHEQWSGWMDWMLPRISGPERMEWLARWYRQKGTPYELLSDEEKASDRKEADRILAVVQGGLLPQPEEPPGDFRTELERLINRHSLENGSNTPDFILAIYMAECLRAFDNATLRRDEWYGRETRLATTLPEANDR